MYARASGGFWQSRSGILGPVVGRDLLVNGEFANGTTGWTLAASTTLTVVSGAGRVTNNGTAEGYIFQSVPTLVGRTYRVRCDIVNAGGGLPTIRVGTSEAGLQYLNISAGVGLVRFFRATEAAAFVTCKNNVNTDTFFSDFDNVSVQLWSGTAGT